MTGRASDLVAELVPIERVPALEGGYRAPPDAQASADWIASELDIAPQVTERCLRQLEAAMLVAQVGDNGYRATGALTVDTKAAPERVRTLNAHWAEVALARIAEPEPEDQFGYNVFSVAEADLERIRGVLRASFREIRAIVAGSQTSEAVALLNLQLMRFGRARRRRER
jgi:hypothetical protein